MMLLVWMSLAVAGPVADGAERWADDDLVGAIELWEPAAAAGWGSGRVKFNVGNAYYRRGDLPRAIAYWRAAGFLRPRTPGVNHNLAIARSELSGVSTPAGTPSLWMQIFTPGELGLLGLFLASIGSAMLFLRRRRKEASRIPGLLVWAVGASLIGVSTWGWWQQAADPVAVVVDQAAVARDSPQMDAHSRFELEPGSEVRVVQTSGSFLLIETGDDKRGWVTDGAVLRVPR